MHANENDRVLSKSCLVIFRISLKILLLHPVVISGYRQIYGFSCPCTLVDLLYMSLTEPCASDSALLVVPRFSLKYFLRLTSFLSAWSKGLELILH